MMEIKEAIEVLRDFNKQVSAKADGAYQSAIGEMACNVAIKALEKAEKYRWHDLRKNPDDLPKRDGNDESDYVLVLIGKPEWNHWEQAYYNHAKHMWSTYEQNVIGWKAIEPFEKEVE